MAENKTTLEIPVEIDLGDRYKNPEVIYSESNGENIWIYVEVEDDEERIYKLMRVDASELMTVCNFDDININTDYCIDFLKREDLIGFAEALIHLDI